MGSSGRKAGARIKDVIELQERQKKKKVHCMDSEQWLFFVVPTPIQIWLLALFVLYYEFGWSSIINQCEMLQNMIQKIVCM